MQTRSIQILSVVTLLFGVLLYVLGVAGALADEASAPGDVGLLGTSAALAILGVLGLAVARSGAPTPHN